jgi:hypothetical protein
MENSTSMGSVNGDDLAAEQNDQIAGKWTLLDLLVSLDPLVMSISVYL